MTQGCTRLPQPSALGDRSQSTSSATRSIRWTRFGHACRSSGCRSTVGVRSYPSGSASARLYAHCGVVWALRSGISCRQPRTVPRMVMSSARTAAVRRSDRDRRGCQMPRAVRRSSSNLCAVVSSWWTPRSVWWPLSAGWTPRAGQAQPTPHWHRQQLGTGQHRPRRHKRPQKLTIIR